MLSNTRLGGLPDRWGATLEEHARCYPADDVLTGPVRRLTRAVTAQAPADIGYRWLCQLAVAPYSYDWIDNLGQRSPQWLTPGAEHLELGQEMMVCGLVDITPGHQYTGRGLPRAERLYGRLAATYAAEPIDSQSCRLLCRLVIAEPSGLGRIRAAALAWGDVVMMRKQLLNLAQLAEYDTGGRTRR